MNAGTRALVFGVGAVVAAVLLALTFLVSSPTPAGPAPVQVQLAIVWNSTDQSWAWSPAAVHVPRGAPVAFTILNYDTENHSVPARYCEVNGTFGGMMGYGFGSGMMGGGMMRDVAALPPSDVSHTFTVTSGGLSVNVPIPPASSPSTPSVVTFTMPGFEGAAAHWYCEAMGSDTMMGDFFTG